MLSVEVKHGQPGAGISFGASMAFSAPPLSPLSKILGPAPVLSEMSGPTSVNCLNV